MTSATVTRWREQLGVALYNILVTYIPSHTIRIATLRLFGARIGRGTSVFRGTTVFDIHRLSIGVDSCIGFRCVLDARGGIVIGDDVVIASDTHIITGKHLPHTDTFEAEFRPVQLEDHVWVASRSTIVDGVTMGRGSVAGACSLVKDDVPPMAIVAGVPARPVGERESALTYSGRFRPLFY